VWRRWDSIVGLWLATLTFTMLYRLLRLMTVDRLTEAEKDYLIAMLRTRLNLVEALYQKLKAQTL
jgi:hypothetical protein